MKVGIWLLAYSCLFSSLALHTLSGALTQQEGDVRLKGLPNNGRGVVEIFTHVGWSTICPDSSWTLSDANFVCQALGYESGNAET